METLSLAKNFPAADEAAWMALVEKALRGADFANTLLWRNHDGLVFKPLYTAADERAAPAMRAMPSQRPWHIAQLCANPHPDAANREILDDLAGGGTAIALQTAAPGQFGVELSSIADLERALDGVHLELAGVVLRAGTAASRVALWLEDIWRAKNIAPDKAIAAFNIDPLGTLARTGGLPVSMEQALGELATRTLKTAESWPRATTIQVDTTPYHDGGASEAQELACLCATMVAYLRTLEAAGLETGKALRQMTFALAADTGQFLTIAKLRAARALIARIAELSGGADGSAPIRLHATTSVRMLAASDPWVNVLRTTMACAAAAMGGADTITVLPHTWPLGQGNAFARRIARNIQIVLQEESALGAVLDPAGGAWHVESATTALADAAWAQFQEIERQGGMFQALSKGFIQKQIAETAVERALAIATGSEQLTGVTAYPEIGAKATTVDPHPLAQDMEEPAITVEPIPLRAPSEPFDRLRSAADTHFDESGKRPAIFLACLSKPADFATPAAYAQNFFAAGGINVITNEGFADAGAAAKAFTESNTKLACICSSDAVYAAMAADAARALTKADARHIYLAGRPGEDRPSLRDAGVGTFIHQGCDMLEVLETAHDLLGIRAI